MSRDIPVHRPWSSRRSRRMGISGARSVIERSDDSLGLGPNSRLATGTNIEQWDMSRLLVKGGWWWTVLRRTGKRHLRALCSLLRLLLLWLLLPAAGPIEE